MCLRKKWKCMRYLGYLMGALLVLSCESNETKSFQSDLGESVLKGQDESVVIVDTSKGISCEVKVLSINDSRCFSDVVCVHAGWATVNFEIQGVTPFALNIGESKVFSTKGQSLKLTLTDVVPYPSTVNQQEKKEAVFIVTTL